MNTPIYDSLKAKQTIIELRIPFTYTIGPNPVDSPAREPWALTDPRYYAKVTGVFPKPEPKWRTFLRCLLWWLP